MFAILVWKECSGCLWNPSHRSNTSSQSYLPTHRSRSVFWTSPKEDEWALMGNCEAYGVGFHCNRFLFHTFYTLAPFSFILQECWPLSTLSLTKSAWICVCVCVCVCVFVYIYIYIYTYTYIHTHTHTHTNAHPHTHTHTHTHTTTHTHTHMAMYRPVTNILLNVVTFWVYCHAVGTDK